MSTSKFHLAITVNNIKNLIPITLEMEKSQYFFWAGLFQIHCRAYDVLDHIFSQMESASSSTTSDVISDPTPSTESIAAWDRIYAIVLQLIYGTIYHDLLRTIFKPESTAQKAWERLKNILHDNKHSRVVHLQHQLTNTRIKNFTDASTYCQELKILSEQLANVGQTIEEDRLVLQLVTGLNYSYDGLQSIITHRDNQPAFYEARTMLILEEYRKNKQAPSLCTALLTSNSNTTQSSQPKSLHATQFTPRPQNPQTHERGRGNYRGRNYHNRGRGRNSSYNNYQSNASGWNNGPNYWINSWTQPWAAAPSPHPPVSWPKYANNNNNNYINSQSGLLGPGPRPHSSPIM
ncbi:uncharacterized protein [Rutidosis leptorrhynchoides]|uniref:uncharacterized protein n=1 Tax=Rutidosis leptorrhynchoides TaxID=125765 RepID=UPI003A9A385C